MFCSEPSLQRAYPVLLIPEWNKSTVQCNQTKARHCYAIPPICYYCDYNIISPPHFHMISLTIIRQEGCGLCELADWLALDLALVLH